MKNTGFLQTATEKVQAIKIVEPVLLEVEPGDNLEILFGERIAKLGHIDGGSESEKSSFVVRKKDESKNNEKISVGFISLLSTYVVILIILTLKVV